VERGGDVVAGWVGGCCWGGVAMSEYLGRCSVVADLGAEKGGHCRML